MTFFVPGTFLTEGIDEKAGREWRKHGLEFNQPTLTRKYELKYDTSSKLEAERIQESETFMRKADKLKAEHKELLKTRDRLRRAVKLLVDNRQRVYNFLIGLLKDINEIKCNELREKQELVEKTIIDNSRNKMKLEEPELLSLFNENRTDTQTCAITPTTEFVARLNYCCMMRAPDKAFYELLKLIRDSDKLFQSQQFPNMSIPEIETCCFLLLDNLQFN